MENPLPENREPGDGESRRLLNHFNRAIHHLSSETMAVRLGGIYALELIARENGDLYWPILDILTTYLREQSPRSDPESSTRKRVPADVQAVLDVLGRREWSRESPEQVLVLMKTDLANAVLDKIHLKGAVLERADLRGASVRGTLLVGARLANADLRGANLRGVNLMDAELEGADLSGADLTRANLTGVNLTGAVLREASFTRATLTGAVGTRADFEGSVMKGTVLAGATLSGANFTGTKALSLEEIGEAFIDNNTLLPANSTSHEESEDAPPSDP